MDEVDRAYADAEDRAVVARLQALSETGPVPAVADVRPWSAPEDQGRASASAGEVIAETERHWIMVGGLVYPSGDWIGCPVCSSKRVVIRCWQWHERPGTPTVKHRCDVHVKCGACAAGWWHGVAVRPSWWLARVRPTGLRATLSAGSSFEPRIWAADRRFRRG